MKDILTSILMGWLAFAAFVLAANAVSNSLPSYVMDSHVLTLATLFGGFFLFLGLFLSAALSADFSDARYPQVPRQYRAHQQHQAGSRSTLSLLWGLVKLDLVMAQPVMA